MNQPIYSAQGGGKLNWRVVSPSTDYSNQLASIDGLEKKVDFNGGIFASTVTIQLAGGGLLNNDNVGTILTISLVDDAGNELAGWGGFVIQSVETIYKTVKITAQSKLFTQTPDDYNFYEVMARDPRRAARNWLMNASNTTDNTQYATYTDAHYRSESRVVPAAATLAGINGLLDAYGGTDSCLTEIQVGTAADSGSWTATRYTGYYPVCWDWQCDLCPGYAKRNIALPTNPLYFHQYNNYWYLQGIFRHTSPALTSDKCQFPLGVVEYVWLDPGYWGGVNGAVRWLYPSNRTISPAETGDITLEFKTRRQARQYHLYNGMRKVDPQNDDLIVQFGGEAVMEREGKTVTYKNIQKYKGLIPGFYNDARAILAPTASVPANSEVGEYVSWNNITISTQNPVDNVIPGDCEGIMGVELQFAPQMMNALWQQAGISGLSSLTPGYRLTQQVYPITVAQNYTQKTHFKQACILGTVGFFQNTETKYMQIDVCPEHDGAEPGTVFELPLTSSTVVSLENGQDNLLAATYSIKITDPYSQNFEYSYTDSALPGANTESFDVMQGQIYGGASASLATNYTTINAASYTWKGNPAMLVDRWHGSQTTATHLAGLSSVATAADGAYLLGSDGQLRPFKGGSGFGDYADVSVLGGYAVRDMNGIQHRLFAEASLRLDTGINWQKGKTDPYIDVFPLISYINAYKRVYSDNIRRHSWQLQTTMAFASAEPGDVVVVKLQLLYNNSPVLAMIMGVNVTSLGRCILEIVPMHIITSSDYTQYTNLRAIVDTIL